MNGLHLAAYNGDLEALDTLTNRDVDGRDQAGYTPLHWSCFRGSVGNQAPVIKALIAAGADPNAITSKGDASCLMLAVESGSQAAVEAIISEGASVNLSADGVTPLMIAALEGNEGAAYYLLRHGADPSVKCGRFTAADYAAYHGHSDLAEQLSPRE